MPSIFSRSAAPDPDAGLVRRLKCREPQAFEELLDTYQDPIYGFVYRLLDDPSDAPDVAQEVFLKVFRKIDDFRQDSTLKTWLYRIAVHEASNRRRWFARHRRQEVSVEGVQESNGGAWEWLRDQRDTPYETVKRGEQLDLVEQSLRKVDERLRSAVVLRDIEGMNYNEIAATLGISLGTVKSRILRGREALKAEVHRRLASEALRGVPLQAE